MRVSRRAVSATALLCLSAAAVAGCGPVEKAEQEAAKLSPKLELRQASTALAQQQAVTTTVSVGGSATDLVALLNSTPAASKAAAKADAGDLTAEQAQAILDSAVAVTVDRGADTASTKDDAAAVTVRYAKADVLEARAVSGALFARLQTGPITSKHPQAKSALAAAQQQAAILPGATELLAGKWVTLSAADVTRLTKLAGESAGSVPDAKQGAKTAAEVKEALSRLVEKSELTRDAADATHLVATVKAADLKAEALTLVKSAAANTPALAEVEDELAKVQPGTATLKVDFWVKDGALNAVELDLAQFGGRANSRVPVRATFTKAAPVTAPASPVKLDVSALLGAS